MKSKIFIPILALASMMLACTDLDEKVYSEITASDYGKTPEELATIAGGAYASLRGGNEGNFNYFPSGEFVFFLNEVSSDEATIPTRVGRNWYDDGVYRELQKHRFTSENKVFYCAWLYCFRGIAACNLALQPIQISDMPEEDKNKAMAEIRGVRAYYYYLALSWWGNVPIVIDYADVTPPVTKTKAEVYQFLENELTDIIPYLGVDPVYGRITQNVANGLLARLYINSENLAGRARYQECLDVCNEIDETKYPLTSGANYFTMFSSTNETNKEIMFAIPFDFTNANISGNAFFANTMHYSQSAAFSGYAAGGNNGICAQPGVYSSFDSTDLRRGSLLFGPQISLATGEVILMGGSGGGNRPLIYTEEIDSAFALDDNGEPLYLAVAESGCRLFKYKPKAGQNPQADHDFVLMRYAEIIMMKAECLVRLNRAAEADVEMDKIRSRVGLPSLALAGKSQTDQLALLDKEWLHEFIFEFLRRDVNIRFGTYLNPWWEKGQDPATALLFPVPAVEIQKNSSLKQNPGY